MALETFNSIAETIDREGRGNEFYGTPATELVKEEQRVLQGKDFKQSMIDLASKMVGQDIILVPNQNG